MARQGFRVPLFGNMAKSVLVYPGDNAGATIGTDLFYADGTLVHLADIVNAPATTGGGADISTTDDLNEGAYNLYFTDARAQHAVGFILQDSTNVTLRYTAGAGSASPTIVADLRPTGVTPGTYGDFMHVPEVVLDANGRVVSAISLKVSDFLTPPFPVTVGASPFVWRNTTGFNCDIIVF